MTTDSKPDDIETRLTHDGISVDWFLQTLSNLTHSQGLEFGITLHVSGQTISDLMIGGKRYFELFADSFSDAWPNDDKDTIREAFAKNAELYIPKEGGET